MARSKRPLSETHPEIAAQWHPSENGDVGPDQVTPGSGRKVWWKCDVGPDHKWQATVEKRTKGNGCPYCCGKRASLTNNLVSTHPELVEQWHPTRNGSLTPDDVTPGMTRRVWWLCARGHEWEAVINNRTKGNGCPYCCGKRASSTNNLAATHPDLAAQWHPRRNGDRTPRQVTQGSNRKVWWRCAHGHEWDAAIHDRIKGNGCPYCSGRRASPSNNLAVTHPEIAAQWHPHENGDLTPVQVTAGSRKKVWWKCPQGGDHAWRATIVKRTHGSRCPFCAGKRVCSATSLAANHPELASQWHPHANDELRPDQVMSGSGRKVWWLCPRGHVWDAVIHNRIKGRGCPYCSRRRASSTKTLAAAPQEQ